MGIAITIDVITVKKLKSLNKINSSNLKIKASQVDKAHKPKSIKIIIALFEYR
jgi:hypothetical protein